MSKSQRYISLYEKYQKANNVFLKNHKALLEDYFQQRFIYNDDCCFFTGKRDNLKTVYLPVGIDNYIYPPIKVEATQVFRFETIYNLFKTVSCSTCKSIYKITMLERLTRLYGQNTNFMCSSCFFLLEEKEDVTLRYSNMEDKLANDNYAWQEELDSFEMQAFLSLRRHDAFLYLKAEERYNAICNGIADTIIAVLPLYLLNDHIGYMVIKKDLFGYSVRAAFESVISGTLLVNDLSTSYREMDFSLMCREVLLFLYKDFQKKINEWI